MCLAGLLCLQAEWLTDSSITCICDGKYSLSPWRDLDVPRSHSSGIVCEVLTEEERANPECEWYHAQGQGTRLKKGEKETVTEQQHLTLLPDCGCSMISNLSLLVLSHFGHDRWYLLTVSQINPSVLKLLYQLLGHSGKESNVSTSVKNPTWHLPGRGYALYEPRNPHIESLLQKNKAYFTCIAPILWTEGVGLVDVLEWYQWSASVTSLWLLSYVL